MFLDERKGARGVGVVLLHTLEVLGVLQLRGLLADVVQLLRFSNYFAKGTPTISDLRTP